MKKFYSLLAAVALTATINAQVVLTENFTAYSTGDNTTSPGSTDVYTNSTNVATFPTGTKVYSAGGMAKLGTSSLIGSMTTGNLNLSTNGGNVKVTFDVKGWTTVEGPIVVTLSGQTAKEVTYTALSSGTPQTVSVVFTGGTASSTVTIATKAKRAYIDNVKIETYSTLAVGDLNATKANLVKNTIVANELIFGASAKVSVYNTAGQVVKTAEVSDNSRLDVSALPKGNYVVTGLVNGQAVSQKIIKK